MYEWCKEYAASLAYVQTEYKVEWEAERFLVDTKSFGMCDTDNSGRPIVTLKLPPETNEMLQEMYQGEIVPGYYSNKVHAERLGSTLAAENATYKTAYESKFEGAFDQNKPNNGLEAEFVLFTIQRIKGWGHE